MPPSRYFSIAIIRGSSSPLITGSLFNAIKTFKLIMDRVVVHFACAHTQLSGDYWPLPTKPDGRAVLQNVTNSQAKLIEKQGHFTVELNGTSVSGIRVPIEAMRPEHHVLIYNNGEFYGEITVSWADYCRKVLSKPPLPTLHYIGKDCP